MSRFPPANNAGPVEAGKKKTEQGNIKTLLTALIEKHKAGSPTDEKVYWISIKPCAIANLFDEQHHQRVSNGVVKRLLRELGYGYRKQAKHLATGTYSRRNEQFEIICYLVLFMSVEGPVLSIDCKKKERLGNLYREGKCYCTQAIKVYDHDYEHLSEGKVIPHGIYDLKANKGYISIGSSSETAEFAVDNLLWWWKHHGSHLYRGAKTIMLLCDAGGSNSYRHHIFKIKLMAFARQTGLSVMVCHYPPYCSKWNPIEHRLFPYVHAATSGAVFRDYSTVKKLMENTATLTGLAVVVRLNLKHYEKGIKALKTQIDEQRIDYHPDIPELNYLIFP